MTKAHNGSLLSYDRSYIYPIEFEDILFPYYTNTSSRLIHPEIEVCSFVEDSKFGKVLAIEQSTTNLLTDPFFSSLSNWEKTPEEDTASKKISYNVVDTPYGKGLHVIWERKSGTDNQWFSFRNTARWTATGSISLSAKLLPIHFAGNAQIECRNSAVSNDYGPTRTGTSVYAQVINGNHVGRGWIDIQLTRSNDWGTYEGSNTACFEIYTNPMTEGRIAEFIIAIPQIEQNSWSTSFVNGSKGTGHVQYSKEIFPNEDFTVNMWISHTGDTRIGNTMKLISLGMDITTARLTLWNYYPISSDVNNRRIIADFGNNDSGSRQYKDLNHSTLFVPHQWEMLTIVFNSSTNQFRFYRNGVLWTTHTPTKINNIDSLNLYNSGWKYSNLLICPRVVDDNEIKSWYYYNKAFYDPYDYTVSYG